MPFGGNGRQRCGARGSGADPREQVKLPGIDGRGRCYARRDGGDFDGRRLGSRRLDARSGGPIPTVDGAQEAAPVGELASGAARPWTQRKPYRPSSFARLDGKGGIHGSTGEAALVTRLAPLYCRSMATEQDPTKPSEPAASAPSTAGPIVAPTAEIPMFTTSACQVNASLWVLTLVLCDVAQTNVGPLEIPRLKVGIPWALAKMVHQMIGLTIAGYEKQEGVIRLPDSMQKVIDRAIAQLNTSAAEGAPLAEATLTDVSTVQDVKPRE